MTGDKITQGELAEIFAAVGHIPLEAWRMITVDMPPDDTPDQMRARLREIAAEHAKPAPRMSPALGQAIADLIVFAEAVAEKHDLSRNQLIVALAAVAAHSLPPGAVPLGSDKP